MNRRHVLRIVTALSAGLIFGFGLSLSGMVDPTRVLGFLDVAGAHRNPSLLYVLDAADTMAILAFGCNAIARNLSWTRSSICRPTESSTGALGAARHYSGSAGDWPAFAPAQPSQPWRWG